LQHNSVLALLLSNSKVHKHILPVRCFPSCFAERWFLLVHLHSGVGFGITPWEIHYNPLSAEKEKYTYANRLNPGQPPSYLAFR